MGFIHFKKAKALAAAICVGFFGPAMAYADLPSPLAGEIQHSAQAAGWTGPEIKALLEKTEPLRALGMPEKALESVVDGTLSLGSPAMDKAFDRLKLLIAQGLAPEAAGGVVTKESLAEQKASDEEMERSLDAGLSGKGDNPSNDEVLTPAQIEEKLEQKREEWEEKMERQDQILSTQSGAGQNHTKSAAGL
jgi:hypothetical protein